MGGQIVIYHSRLCECIGAHHLAFGPGITRVIWGNLMELGMKLTGAVQDFREEAGEADVMPHRTSYTIYKTI